MGVRREIGLACPSRWSRPSTARTSQFDDSSDGHVRQLLGQAGPRTHRTSLSEELIHPVQGVDDDPRLFLAWKCQKFGVNLLFEGEAYE
ncbi:hypothetical protein PSTG_07571 [Puccinia striiformis f. sp. tritici PST-78]|uniref:Uncharacterized protein n=1 Tax=Puccinia striiformis f. sp. tritici PST-78 TaxID=1165861 RepID=A0A0L0VIQ7_9BASI|nr:hypothetical protein PSTG_07571 [Puccinia striiformis f. sp. tritici PST-78]